MQERTNEIQFSKSSINIRRYCQQCKRNLNNKLDFLAPWPFILARVDGAEFA